MRQHGLNSRCRRKWRLCTTDNHHNRSVAPHLLAPNEKWVGDIVGVRTEAGWLYLAALLDVFSRRIVGWAMSDYRDEQLVEDALHMALKRRHIQPESKLLHHTDRGSQYTADDYLALLTEYSIQLSMSNKGDPYDNAMIESFFATLRAELTELQIFRTRLEARIAIFDFIELFYNRQRVHSSIGSTSPAAFKAQHLS